MARRTTTGTTWMAVMLAAGSAVALTGCVPATDTPHIDAVLATPREAEDELPPGILDGDADLDSSRLLGTVDHLGYFVAGYSDTDRGDGVCLVVVNTESEAAVASCSASETGMAVSGAGLGSARISAETVTYPASDGWVRLTDFLLVNPASSRL